MFTRWIRFRLGLSDNALLLFFIYFIFLLATTMPLPIVPLFMRHFVPSDAYVGLLVGLFAVIWVAATLCSGFLLRHYNKIRLGTFAIAFLSISFALLLFVKSLWHLIIVYSAVTVCFAVAVMVFGLFVRETASKKTIGKMEGVSFTLMNSAYLIGPLTGGVLAKFYGFSAVFAACASLAAVSMLLIVFGKLREKPSNHYEHQPILANIRDYFSNKNMIILYLISWGIITWWVIVYTYMPLFMQSGGLSEMAIGIALAVFVIPLLLFELPVSIIAGRTGYRQFMSAGFLIIALFLLLAAFISNMFIFIASITLACIGAAFIEPLREAYFFSSVANNDEARLYSVYMTSPHTIRLVAPLVFSAVLFLTSNSYKALYIVGALLMLLFGVLAMFLKKQKPRDI